MTSLTPLIQALQEATGPSRELDARIWCALGDDDFVGIRDEGTSIAAVLYAVGEVVFLHQIPLFTSSLDAITALIEREFPNISYNSGVSFDTAQDPPVACFSAFIHISHKPGRIVYRHGATEPLARCIAFLAALQARGAQSNG